MESCGINEFRYKIEKIDLNNITAEDIIRANLTKEETKRFKDYLKQSKNLNDKIFIQNRKMREIGSKINKVGRSRMVNELYNIGKFDLLRDELLHLKNPDIDTSERYEKKVIQLSIEKYLCKEIYFKLFSVSRKVQSDETSNLTAAEEYENIIKSFAKANYIAQLEELEKAKQ